MAFSSVFPCQTEWPFYILQYKKCTCQAWKLLKLNYLWFLFSNAMLMFNKHRNKLFILDVWISIEKTNIVGSLNFPEGRDFGVPLRQCLEERYFTCTLNIWSMVYLTCPRGRISDLLPRQGLWPAPRAWCVTCPKGRISDLWSGLRVGSLTCPPGQSVWPVLRAGFLAWPEARYLTYPLGQCLGVRYFTCALINELWAGYLRAGSLTCLG